MKLLTICIPTYKRPDTLRRSIQSVVAQIQHFGLEDRVRIYVTNDASPDNTAQVLDEFNSLSCFKGVNREKNLGMSANIKCMLEEALRESTFQLIITDDDYLQPDVLPAIVTFLSTLEETNPEVPLIWTPRYSYTEDGKLHGIVCRAFQQDTVVVPSIENAGRYMFNGFVLSGLIIKSREINFSLWGENLENGYFPVIVSGELMLKKSTMFWDVNVVHHSVLNECHWESWGRSEAEISLKLFIDFMNAYVVIARRTSTVFESIAFYWAAFPNIVQIVNSLLITSGGFGQLSKSESEALLSIAKVSSSRIEAPAKLLWILAVSRISYGCLRNAAIYKLLLLASTSSPKASGRKEAYARLRQQLGNIAFLMRWAC